MHRGQEDAWGRRVARYERCAVARSIHSYARDAPCIALLPRRGDRSPRQPRGRQRGWAARRVPEAARASGDALMVCREVTAL